MTIIECLNRIDALKPNSYERDDKIRWLSTLDGLIYNNIIKTHEGAEGVEFSGYNVETPIETVLLVPAPYDEIYIKWLEAQIHYASEETGKYNNALIAYNDAYSAFERYYNRTHMPKGTSFKFF